MKLPKFKKEQLCTAAMMLYHITFLGGAATMGNHYLSEYQKTRDTIVSQVDRAEAIVKSAQKTVDDAGKSIKGITKELKKVRKVCGKIKVPKL